MNVLLPEPRLLWVVAGQWLLALHGCSAGQLLRVARGAEVAVDCAGTSDVTVRGQRKLWADFSDHEVELLCSGLF